MTAKLLLQATLTILLQALQVTAPSFRPKLPLQVPTPSYFSKLPLQVTAPSYLSELPLQVTQVAAPCYLSKLPLEGGCRHHLLFVLSKLPLGVRFTWASLPCVGMFVLHNVLSRFIFSR